MVDGVTFRELQASVGALDDEARCPRHNRLRNHGYPARRDRQRRWHTYRPDGTEIW